jgi:uncharacterized membrane protein
MSIFTDALSGTRARYLLLGSLTLNLVFAGAAGAVAFQRATKLPPLQPIVGMNPDVEQRFDRIAAALPPNDATIMRAEFHVQAIRLATAETQVRLSDQAVRDSLRAQPFDPAATRTAMARSSQAKDRFFDLVHETIAGATAKMSPAGRKALADWPRRRIAAVTQ